MRKIVAFVAMALLLNACAQRAWVIDPQPRNAPPGQVKTVTGSKSAAPYAPGLQKKKY